MPAEKLPKEALQQRTFLETIRNVAENRVTRIVLTAAMLDALLAACTDQVDATPTSAPTSISSSPSPEHTESTPTPTPTAETGTVSPEQIAQAKQERQSYLDMTPEAFEALPQAERATFYALTNKIYENDLVQMWRKGSNDTSASLPELNAESSPEDIASYSNWGQRLAYYLTGNERELYMISMFWEGSQSPSYAVIKKDSDTKPESIKPSVLAYNEQLPDPDVVGNRPAIVGANGIRTMDIDIEDNNVAGAVGTFRFWETPVTVLGQSEDVWRVQ